MFWYMVFIWGSVRSIIQRHTVPPNTTFYYCFNATCFDRNRLSSGVFLQNFNKINCYFFNLSNVTVHVLQTNCSFLYYIT